MQKTCSYTPTLKSVPIYIDGIWLEEISKDSAYMYMLFIVKTKSQQCRYSISAHERQIGILDQDDFQTNFSNKYMKSQFLFLLLMF